MKELRQRQQMMIVESREMAEAIQEFTLGLRQQVLVHNYNKHFHALYYRLTQFYHHHHPEVTLLDDLIV